MITGRVPFAGDDIGALLNAHLKENIPDIHSTMEDIPEELHTLVRKATQKEPSARYQKVSEILGEIQPLSEKLRVRTQPGFGRQDKMIGMFLVYQEEQELVLKRFIEEFSKHVKETGAVLRITKFED